MALALVAVAPVVLAPAGLERWVLAKELCLVVAALLACAAPPTGRTPRWWLVWLAAATAVLGLGAALGDAPVAQALGRWPRYEGIITLGAYALAVWLGARLLGGHTASAGLRESRTRVFAAALAWALTATAVVAVAEALGMRPLGGDVQRPGSLLGNASDLGVFGVVGLALLIPAALARLAPRKRGPAPALMPAVGAVSALAVIALSASRAALVAGVLVIAAHAVVQLRRDSQGGRRSARNLAIAGGALVFTSLALPLTRSRVTGATDLARESAANRIDLWSTAADLTAANPIAGVGANGFADAVTAHLPPTWFAAVGTGSWVESPHNLVLQVLAAGGILGAALVIAAGVCAVLGMRRHGVGGPFGAAGLIALGGWAVALLTHATSPGTTMLVAFVAGTAISRDTAGTARRWVTVASTVALAVWAAALALALVADAHLKTGIDLLVSAPAEAEQRFADANRLRPWDADLPLMVAESYAGALDSQLPVDAAAATQWADRAVERLPGSTRALVASAIIAQYSGDLATASKALEQASLLSPTDPQVYHRLGGILLLGGDVPGAIASLERAQSLDPENADVRLTLEYARSLAP